MFTYIIGTVLALAGLGTLILKFMKGSVAEDLLQNQETKTKVTEIEQFIAKDQGLLDAEKAKRDQAEADLKAKENQSVTKDNLLDFVNKSNNTNK